MGKETMRSTVTAAFEQWEKSHESASDKMMLLAGSPGDGVYMIQPGSDGMTARKPPFRRGGANYYIWIDGKLVKTLYYSNMMEAEITWLNMKENPKRALF